MHRWLYGSTGAALALCSLAAIGARDVLQHAPQAPLSAADAGRILAEVPAFEWRSVQLSPDGAWVVYAVTRPSLTENTNESHWWLQRVPADTGRAPASAPVPLPSGANAVQWCPDGRCLSLILSAGPQAEGTRPTGFVRYDVATGRMTTLQVRDTAARAGSPGARPRVTAVGEDYQWSLRGNYLAFTAPLVAVRQLIVRDAE